MGVLAALCVPLAARAQIESALLSKVSFNLANPGGKSLAMGGAFTAIADDATAALANPAGLGLLSSVEVGFSGKRFDDVIELVTARSTVTGSNLIGPYPAVRAVNSDLRSTHSSPEYAAVVLPVSRRLVLAATYAENLRFAGDAGEDGYSFIELRDNRAGGLTRRDFLYEYREFGTVSLQNRQLGLSVGLRVTDRLRLGAGLTLNRTRFDLGGDASGPHRIVDTTFLTPSQVDVRTVTMAVEGFDGTTPGLVLGVHADLVPRGALTVGASAHIYRRTHGTLVIGGDVPQQLQGATRRDLSFGIPRDAALGLATQPFPGLTVAVEGQWVAYADAFRESLPVNSYSGLVGPSPGFPVDGILAELMPSRDVFVPRIGAEYVAVKDTLRLAFRIGYHREPAHGVTANLVARDGSGTPYDITDPPLSSSVRTVFDGGRPDDRFSAGLGLTLGRSLSMDVAFDVGRASRQLAASVFYRF